MLSSWRRIASNCHRVLLLVVIEHVSQDIFGVLQSLGHLCVVRIESLIKWHRRSVTLLVDIGYVSILRVEQDLSVILEVNLHDLVAQTEHDGMLGPHPLLHVNRSWWILKLVGLVEEVPLNELLLLLRIVILLEVTLEVLEQSDLLLQLLWEVGEAVLRHHVLLLISCDGFPLVVVELSSAGLGNDLRGVIEEDTC